jgi:hypothetical protein
MSDLPAQAPSLDAPIPSEAIDRHERNPSALLCGNAAAHIVPETTSPQVPSVPSMANTSTTGLNQTLLPNALPMPAPFDAWRKLKVVRRNMLAQRAELRKWRDLCTNNRHLTDKYGDQLVHMLMQIVQDGNLASRSNDVIATVKNFEEPKRILDRYEELAKEEANKLLVLEYECGILEDEIFNWLESHFTNNSNDGFEKFPIDEETQKHDHPDAASMKTLDPRLRQYYELRGRLEGFREELQELVLEHQEETSRRETRANVGEPVFPTDLEFHDIFQKAQADLQMCIEDSSREVKALREECILHGLEPQEDEDFCTISDEPAEAGNISKRNSTASTFSDIARFEAGSKEALLSRQELLSTGFQSKVEQIGTWFAGQNSTSPAPTQPFNSRPSTPLTTETAVSQTNLQDDWTQVKQDIERENDESLHDSNSTIEVKNLTTQDGLQRESQAEQPKINSTSERNPANGKDLVNLNDKPP